MRVSYLQMSISYVLFGIRKTIFYLQQLDGLGVNFKSYTEHYLDTDFSSTHRRVMAFHTNESFGDRPFSFEMYRLTSRDLSEKHLHVILQEMPLPGQRILRPLPRALAELGK